MPLCSSKKRDNTPCFATALPGSDRCYNHDPGQAARRRANASKGGRAGGRGRGQVEVQQIKALLSELIEQVLSDTIDRGSAVVANQLINSRLRAVEVERKLRETEELEERLAAIEQAIEGGNYVFATNGKHQ